VCYISAQSDYVNFRFARGTELSDPEGVLEGTGKGMRHVKVRTMKDIRRRLLTALIKDAVKLSTNGKKPAPLRRVKAEVQ